MSQVTIYIDGTTESRMRSAAKAANISLSKWISKVIAERLDTQWPDDIKQLAGSWSDFPTLDEIRSSEGKDIKREQL